MQRRALVVGILVVLAVGIAIFLGVRGDGSAVTPPAPGRVDAGIVTARTRIAARRAQPNGSIGGHVVVAPTPGSPARPSAILVCVRARATGQSTCADADAAGEYDLADLPVGHYSVWASAAGFAGPRWSSPTGESELALGAGEHRDNIDLQLLAGAVELEGTVRDLRGPAIEGALVVVESGEDVSFTARTGPDGAFTAWAQPGGVRCAASAAGYTSGTVRAFAPARRVLVELVPASTVEGLVVEARTRQPVAGAIVELGGEKGETDAAGQFRIDGLPPGRYTPTATAVGRYGEARQSVLAPLGGTASGVVIEMHAVAVVAGRILVDDAQRTPCPAGAGEVSLWQMHNRRGATAITDEEGFVLIEGMLPGTYGVAVSCEGYLGAIPYPDLEIGDSDIDEVVWLVNTGARVVGHVRTPSGTPIAEAYVGVAAAASESFSTGRTDATGAYSVGGVYPGAVRVYASAVGHTRSDDQQGAGKATLATPLTVDIVLTPVSSLVVEVVDASGAPLDDIPVRLVGASEADDRSSSGEVEFRNLAQGRYTVSTDRATATVTVGPGETRTRLVGEPLRGFLAGKVVTPDGAPVTDAFVAIRPQSASGGQGAERTTLVRADGTFRFERLLATDYTVRAYREGGAEAVQERAASNSTITLTLGRTGEISGMVVTTDGRPAHDYTVELSGDTMTYNRSERVFHTSGLFTFHDVPPGTYRVSVDSSKTSSETVTLAAGGKLDTIRLVVQSGYAVRGRLVGPDGAPRALWKLQLTYAVRTYARDGETRQVTISDVVAAMSDSNGNFLFRGVPSGTATLAVADVSQSMDAEATDLMTFPIDAGPVDLGIVVAP